MRTSKHEIAEDRTQLAAEIARSLEDRRKLEEEKKKFKEEKDALARDIAAREGMEEKRRFDKQFQEYQEQTFKMEQEHDRAINNANKLEHQRRADAAEREKKRKEQAKGGASRY